MNPLCEWHLLSSFTFTTLREEMLRLRDHLQCLIPVLLNPTLFPLQFQCSFTSQGGKAAPGPREARPCALVAFIQGKHSHHFRPLCPPPLVPHNPVSYGTCTTIQTPRKSLRHHLRPTE